MQFFLCLGRNFQIKFKFKLIGSIEGMIEIWLYQMENWKKEKIDFN